MRVNPEIEAADQGQTPPRGRGEAVRGGPNGYRSHDLTAADICSWLVAAWLLGCARAHEIPMRAAFSANSGTGRKGSHR